MYRKLYINLELSNFIPIFELHKTITTMKKLKQGNLIPTISDYVELINLAVSKFNITVDTARNKYGLFTYKQWNDLLFPVTHTQKFNYSKSTKDIFYEIIYPIFPKEFLFGDNYEKFADLVNNSFILNAEQWEYILEHWEQKENILEFKEK